MGALCLVICFMLASNFEFGYGTACNNPLGLENGNIKDSQITAMGSGAGTEPYNVRYNNNSKSWCVNSITGGVFSDDFYIEFDLLKIKKITSILLAVSNGYKQFSYGPKIKIGYKLTSNDSFTFKIYDTSTLKYPKSEYINMQPPFYASVVRYIPLLDENAKCLNMELFGCNVELQDCNKPVLTKTMDYTESSYHRTLSDQKFLGKYIATPYRGFPWGPDMTKTITSPYQEFVEVNLKDLFVITGVQTTKPVVGGDQLADSFILAHKTLNSPWKNITTVDKKLIEFNTNAALAKVIKIESFIQATNIQFRPNISSGRNVFLKMQLFGCLFKDAFNPKPSKTPTFTSTKSTSAITKSKSSQTTENKDSTRTTHKRPPEPAVIKFYEIRQGDRYKDVGYVGKATKDVLHDGKGVLVDGVNGNQPRFQPSVWVGWRKTQLPTPYVIIILEKAAILRNLYLVSYVDRKQNIGQFASCTIQFSQNELSRWSNGYYVCPREEKTIGAKEMKINLMQNEAERIRLTFNYSDQWLLLSEVAVNTHSNVIKTLDASDKFCNISTTKVKIVAPDSNSTVILLCILIPLLIILVILIVLIIRYRKKIRYFIFKRTKKKRDRQNETIVTYTKEPTYTGSTEHMYSVVKDDIDPSLKKSLLHEKEENANKFNHDYESDDDVMYAAPDQNLLNDQAPVGYIEVSVEPGGPSQSPNYAQPEAKANPETVELNPIYEGTRIYEDPYQTVTGSSLYADPHMDKERVSIEIRKFPREKLRFLEKIGEGQFGEVHICEVDALGSVLNSEIDCSWRMNNTVMVAVKLLKSGVDKSVESEFMKEVRVMARLKHENVVQLLGVCDEEPKCMVVEYMENGDLNQFLKNYSFADYDTGINIAGNKLNEETLMHVCTQISAGMKYLASQGFIHRDLATRNCLVGHSFTVKISDFGMSRYLYSKQYYRIEGKAVLPIRWMAPESLFYGTFTSQTDVWAFAVTIWEIFTFAKEAPFSHLTDQQVIDNACSVVAKQRKAFRCLPQPRGCSNDVYEVLLQCWQRSPDERPNFDGLFQFFSSHSTSVEASI